MFGGGMVSVGDDIYNCIIDYYVICDVVKWEFKGSSIF